MASAGQVVSESMDLPGRACAEVLQRLSLAVCADPAYTVAEGGPNTVHLVRAFRPRWAAVSGSIGTVAFGAGLLLFLVKRTESCSLAAHDGPTGTVVTVSGRLTRSRLEALRAVVADRGPWAQPTGPGPPGVAAPTAPQVPPPPADLWATSGEGGSVPVYLPVVGSPMPPSADTGQAATAARTMLVNERSGSPSPADGGSRLVARFDDGSSIELSGFTLVGRQPQGRPEDGDAALVPIPDPTMTVSKTHLSLRLVPGGVEIVDRASSNGTVVSTAAGHETVLTVGQPLLVPPGSRVRLGDRSFDLVAV